MYNTSRPNSLPKPGPCYNLNILHPWFQRNEVQVMLANQEFEKTVHILADGRTFDFRQAYGTNEDWSYIYIREISYLDEEGNVQIVKLKPRNPHPIEKGVGNTYTGYVTKINGKRWGINIHFSWQSGRTYIRADEGSPIIGALFQFIE